jgi:hypothetical protein
MLRRLWRLGLRKAADGAKRLYAAFLRHILSALEMLRISLFGPPKRHIQPNVMRNKKLEYMKIMCRIHAARKKYSTSIFGSVDKISAILYCIV